MRMNAALVLLVLLSACAGGDRQSVTMADHRTRYPDILDYHGTPEAAEDWSLTAFADQGAWFGFSLQPESRGDLGVGFTGPSLMTGGRWLGRQIAGLDLPGAVLERTTGLPGVLVQQWRVGNLEIEQKLWFDSSRVALIRSEIHNHGKQPWSWTPVWTGDVFDGAASLDVSGGGILARTPTGDRVRVVAGDATGEIAITGHGYGMPLATDIILNPGESTTLILAISMTPGGGDSESEIAAALADPADSFDRNTARWNGYVDSTVGAGTPEKPARIIAIKSIQTLMGNWRGPAGRFAHGGLFPSSNVWYFNGFWAWDSWKHSVALARFDPFVAADQLRLMAGQQDDLGMIADVVYLDPDEDNWRDTKPPLLGWALQEVYSATGDADLVGDLYPPLVRYHEFWYAHRDHDGDGLCEYGSTDGTVEAARWESGMDNAVRFDHIEMLQNAPGSWSMDQESVDLNSYLYREKIALRDLATVLQLKEDEARWEDEATALRAQIQSAMFDEDTGWFYDIHIETDEFVSVQGPEGWIPLWAGVATEAQAGRVRTTMLDPGVFRTHVPFPTVARNHPDFSDGYWRGLVWLDQVYFAIEGLRSYGYGEDADALTAQVFVNLEGAAVHGEPLYENYHPLTGEGRNVRHFSWTAGHLLLLTTADR